MNGGGTYPCELDATHSLDPTDNASMSALRDACAVACMRTSVKDESRPRCGYGTYALVLKSA